MTYACSFYVPLCFVVSPKRCKMAITVRCQKGVRGGMQNQCLEKY